MERSRFRRNKVELANKFSRAVAVGNPHKFTQAEKEGQEIVESGNRLIKSCKVANMSLLRRILRVT
ncbi:MAG: Tn3 family transposase [Candidatus Competibacter denitrificans]|jgi:zona occludens toxin (predicted ATPase)